MLTKGGKKKLLKVWMTFIKLSGSEIRERKKCLTAQPKAGNFGENKNAKKEKKRKKRRKWGFVAQPIKSADAIMCSGIWDCILFRAITPPSFHGCTVSQNKHYLMLSFPVNVNMPSSRSNQGIIGVPLWNWAGWKKKYGGILALKQNVFNFHSEYLPKFIV